MILYVVIRDGEVVNISPHLSAQESAAFFQIAWPITPGEVYACRMSESAATEVRNAWMNWKPGTRNQADPAKLLKLYSHSMTKTMDVT